MPQDFGEKNVTIYDIAARAATSASTVGAVLNGTWEKRRISQARATEIQRVADEMGYTPNMQARGLRRERSRIISMIVPLYDNRYFSSIAQLFEREARARGLFPMISCTARDADLEKATVRQMLDYQVERVICTGATDPDGIAEICARRGVPTLNLDLPGRQAASVISDNFRGAYEMTTELLNRLTAHDPRSEAEILFVGGRPADHNTRERLRGFMEAYQHGGRVVSDTQILTCGYAAEKAEAVLTERFGDGRDPPAALFVNSTISLEGVIRWLRKSNLHPSSDMVFGCFDWDQFATFAAPDIVMVRQNVDRMVEILFEMIDAETTPAPNCIEVPPIIVSVD
ncbi:substrate-binding domain-containing protein [Actibacterium sp. 188UL27-1]|uniref:substrate-binding domain-containing protein n=1 Tax=Actibacterium sp. 188UL27-1 TaxID=2786961 RepID=UPI00351C104C